MYNSLVCWCVTSTENSDEDEYYVFTPNQSRADGDDDDDYEHDDYLRIIADREEISAFKQDYNSVEQ